MNTTHYAQQMSSSKVRAAQLSRDIHDFSSTEASAGISFGPVRRIGHNLKRCYLQRQMLVNLCSR